MRIAAAQAASVWLDPVATTTKAIGLIEQAAKQEIALVAFPETFLSGYPFWVMLGGGRFGDPAHARAYAVYLAAAVELDGPDLRRVTEAARDLRVFAYLGVSERGRDAGQGTVYCTLVAIDPERGIVGAHRKLNPTHTERLVWGRGDGQGLRTRPVGPLLAGGLNCWENWMPLARLGRPDPGHRPLHRARRPGLRRAGQRADLSRYRAQEFPFYQLIQDKPDGLYNGGSCVAAPDGSWVVEPGAGGEGLIMASSTPPSWWPAGTASTRQDTTRDPTCSA